MSGEATNETEPETIKDEYKVSEIASKNVAEILATDGDDESLRKYKETLLGAAAHGDLGDTSDPRRVIVTEFRVMFDPTEGHDDIVFNLDTPEGVADLKSRGVIMKEGCKYKFKISFRVQHEIVAGIKFVNTVKKAVFSETEELMLGSYPPASVPHVFEFPRHSFIEAPKGMLYRGKYYSKNQFIDSDGANHLQYEYELQIKKSWAE